jgi:phosphoribosyl-ATP pyrophosphohydrolase/phosphoribosyl-AMP cyclohydrolase/histidinol dehydrogenase
MPDQSLWGSSRQSRKHTSSCFTNSEQSLMDRCGDYASGTNHTLPTNGFARQFSGVNTLSFQKHITSQELTADGLRKLGPTVITLAEREGLEAHANAVRVRLAALN